MRHPAAGELLELHFEERDGARAAAAGTHARDCAACASVLAELRWAEETLATVDAQAPPVDGLARVLARIETVRPARERRTSGVRTAVPCAAALLAGSLAIQQGGVVAALAFFALGSIVTLALAPVLILESQRRS